MPRPNQHSEPIRNRDACVQAAHKYISKRFAGVAVDKLLTRPLDAVEVAVMAAGDLGKCAKPRAKQIVRYMRSTFSNTPGLEDEVDNILRALLADRKRGRKTRDIETRGNHA